MAAIKNICHRCRATWRLKGEHLSTSCPKCGSQYVGPARGGGIGLIGVLVIAGAAFAGAVYFGFIDKDELQQKLEGITSEGQQQPPAPPPADGKKAAPPPAGQTPPPDAKATGDEKPQKKEPTADDKARSALGMAENYAENGRFDQALAKLSEAEALEPGAEVKDQLAAARARIEKAAAAQKR